METPSPAPIPRVRALRRGLYLLLAGLFFLVGAVGVVLPGLPTTPFLLLTSYFLLRSSPRLHAALLRSRVFGPLLRDWEQHRGVRRAVKYQAVALIVIFVGMAVFLSSVPTPARFLTLGLGLVGITVVVRLPEIARETDTTAPSGGEAVRPTATRASPRDQAAAGSARD